MARNFTQEAFDAVAFDYGSNFFSDGIAHTTRTAIGGGVAIEHQIGRGEEPPLIVDCLEISIAQEAMRLLFGMHGA